MFAWWGRFVHRARWWVLAGAALVVLAGAGWGVGVFGSLSTGGYDDPGSPSSRAYERITEELGRQGDDLVVIYTSPTATVDDPGLREPVEKVVADLSTRPEVEAVLSYYSTQAPAFVSADRHATSVSIQLRDGDENAKLADLEAIEPLLIAGGDVDTEIGGLYSFLRDANSQIESDIVRAEALSLPILFVLMVLIFRGLVAAATPLLVGVVAILGGFVVIRVLAGITEVSVFAVNVITMLGLGMAIDYALFVVNRFREELAAGHPTPVAISRTVATAGRTVAVSGLTVALALSSLLLFPMDFLKSMAYGGMAAVLVAMLAALTALPALLAILGPRVNALRILRRRPADGRAAAGAAEAAAAGAGAAEGGWARVARSVMRRPMIYIVVVSAALLAAGSPFLRASFGGFDERVLPEGTPSRTVAERLAAEFPAASSAPVLALVSGASAQGAQQFADAAARLPGATGAQITANRGDSYLVAIAYEGEPTSAEARQLVRDVRELPPPNGAEVLVTGRSAADLDQMNGLANRLVPMAIYVAVVTFLLLFFAFGSIVLPLKAILMNIISIGAAFGVVVWIFQDGHLADVLGFTSTGYLEPTNLVLMVAILFGLSTDYEVFLLSRVREEWDRTGRNTDSVSAGLQRTGGIITAAALLLIIVVGGFATGGAATIKMLGIGTVVAVAVDATLVRVLLVPATMRLLGRWNWWAPGPLAKAYRRYGIHESEVRDRELAAAR
ncbi:MAG TPA: MMPL family transporter [Micromonosporaceae bacterium]|nr:MMPL family transporter [Micromonosporaceae bacterium]